MLGKAFYIGRQQLVLLSHLGKARLGEHITQNGSPDRRIRVAKADVDTAIKFGSPVCNARRK